MSPETFPVNHAALQGAQGVADAGGIQPFAVIAAVERDQGLLQRIPRVGTASLAAVFFRFPSRRRISAISCLTWLMVMSWDVPSLLKA